MLKRLFSFKGRIGRLEYFLTALFTGVITLPITYAEEEAPPFLIMLILIPIIWINVAQGAKRCHDLGINGFLAINTLLSFCPDFQKRRR